MSRSAQSRFTVRDDPFFVTKMSSSQSSQRVNGASSRTLTRFVGFFENVAWFSNVMACNIVLD